MPDVSNPPGLAESGDVDHDQTQGGTEGNPHADSAGLAIGVSLPVFPSKSDVPADISEGELVYIAGDRAYVEDGQ